MLCVYALSLRYLVLHIFIGDRLNFLLLFKVEIYTKKVVGKPFMFKEVNSYFFVNITLTGLIVWVIYEQKHYH